MPLDRFIYWQEKKADSKEIGRILSAYVQGIAECEYKGDRWFVWLPGKSTNPLAVVGGGPPEGVYAGDRWIEVWVSSECVDVMTRSADPIANAIAEGFAAMIARWYDGRREG